MARGRRKARASVEVNYEIAGVALLGVAIMLGVALIAPSHTGAVGRWTTVALHAAFGAATVFVPIVIALVAAIIFLEVQVPRTMVRLGGAALGYFAIVDAFFGRRGGMLGSTLEGALRHLVGDVGATIVLVVAAIALTVAVTKLSLKRLIGLGIIRARTITLPERAARLASSAATSRKPATPRPGTLREAFSLPPGFLESRSVGATAGGSSALAVIDPNPQTGQHPQPFDIQSADSRNDGAPGTRANESNRAGAVAVTEPHTEDIDDELDDGEYDDDEYDAYDDEYDDDDELDREEAGVDGDDEAIAAGALRGSTPDDGASGEYESPAVVAASSPARGYRLPDLSLFDPPQTQPIDESSRTHLLEDTLASFGVGAKVTHIERGPSITRYELKPDRGIKISRISALSDDLALALAATSVRIEAPIPGKSAVGIEIPNATVSIVAIREIFDAFPSRGTIPPLNMALGKDITGRPVFGDLGRMPHLLVAGATGSGKSVCLNGIIASLLVSATPDQVQLLMIDPKRVELTVYNGIPHLIKEVITDAKLAAGALFEMTKEMDSRYERFAKASVRKIEEYNAKFPDEKLPYVVIVIDELADLMLIAPAKVETTICRLAQLARATGIHLIVATQRPSVDVITGIIKANIPSRIAFAVSSQIDSRTILDMAGAERLLGRGDMLYLPIDAPKPVRSQGALITGAEISRLVSFWSEQGRPPENIVDVDIVPVDDERGKTEYDGLWYAAARLIIETQFASTAALQTQLAVGHPRAVKIMKQLEELKIVGPHEGTKPRKIIAGFGEIEAIALRVGKASDVLA